jgi:hypothetical protein
MMRMFLIFLLMASAGCLSSSDDLPPVVEEPRVRQDSEPIHESHDLTAGIDLTWFLVIVEPYNGSGSAAFDVTGFEDSPAAVHQLCLEHGFTSWTGEVDRETAGVCGGSNLVVSPSIGAQTLYERHGAGLQAGTHRFHVSGGPQVGQLVVSLWARGPD